ncbi:MAG: 30S ribosomal protein S6 [Candidatus Levybacteria bacterium GW2011_GWC1_40_19]|nr:MAG: 30S ribosomal protein S6 [Candidatus Levybacteria bacterium GW2011_GWC1_40_19]KKR73863.1 MAG: 30S ribosomal protein S6 [Candidatus Levybacteria bacterium GW2011_GWC2_40_7]KKR94658.1 MAG: 30S ribosomal protein S6 [Candidatus Levybacteria bacterium GW2011_GWA2_41_15]KKS00397.1 MAG: 30S ribosomal protein S6 [Candidatus Levybacteria bacterium GW2011_GWB1_41_21]OGH26972.1 MAG: 30S ribosomal protein S6 [Candidatus Levybacteria bacterium RIFCSPHIGHO2_02_FULL_40_29]OGH32281.1 MAG: 30S ribosoma
MRKYDLVLVLRTSLKEADRKKILSGVKDSLKDAKISKEEDWGQKPLSYPIKREVSGFYVNIDIESENALPSDFEKRITSQDSVLRHILIRGN